MTHPRILTRRTLNGVAAAGVSVPLLAACGADDDAATDAGSGGSSGSTSASPSASASSAAPSEAESSAAVGATGFTTTADIEVGGGAIFPDEELVVTQPTEGEFKCFSSICTHQGCPVTKVEDGEIVCECHGSTFSIENGEPGGGPASAPLEEVAITVEGDQIVLT